MIVTTAEQTKETVPATETQTSSTDFQGTPRKNEQIIMMTLRAKCQIPNHQGHCKNQENHEFHRLPPTYAHLNIGASLPSVLSTLWNESDTMAKISKRAKE